MSNPHVVNRCDWVTNDPIYIQYHDQEWGVPRHSDAVLFEFLVLESAQAGLSWITILKKRERYRAVFAQFDPVQVARFSPQKVDALLKDPGIVRNRRKIEAAVANAGAFLRIVEKHGSFANYIWQFTDGKPICNHWRTVLEVPAQTIVSAAMSRDLKDKGFVFLGPTICYAFMQAIGMVNDHIIGCFRHLEIQQANR